MQESRSTARCLVPDVLAGLGVVWICVQVLERYGAASTGLAWLALGMYLALALALGWAWPGRRRSFGWPNRVTLLRAALVAVLAGALLLPGFYEAHGLAMAVLAAAALVLDGLDGWLARAFNAATGFGARFDMEIDSLLVLVLSAAVWVTGTAGIWVLGIGLLRYLFVAAGRVRPWLRAELPVSTRRKGICVMQVLALIAAITPMLDAVAVNALLAASLALLVFSFGLDVAWLARRDRIRES